MSATETGRETGDIVDGKWALVKGGLLETVINNVVTVK